MFPIVLTIMLMLYLIFHGFYSDYLLVTCLVM